MIEFKLKKGPDDFIMLNQLLKALFLVESGAMANDVISEGMVIRNGELEQRKRAKIKCGDLIEFNGETIKIL